MPAAQKCIFFCLLVLVDADQADPLLGDSCVVAYGEDIEKWRTLSDVPTVYSPRSHRPDWYWEAILEHQRNGSRSDRVANLQLDDIGYGDPWLEVLFGQAQEGILGCSVHGGRYWEAMVDVVQLRDLVPSANLSKFLEGVTRITPSSGLKAAILAGFVPPSLRVAMCTPYDCTEDMIVKRLFPEFEARKLFGTEAGKLLEGAILTDAVKIEEVLNWPSLQLDFAIAGVDNCGTTSLHRNLDQHPEIVFPSHKEDFFFVTEVVHRLLPLKSQVEDFNHRMELAKQKKLQEITETGVRPRLAGICSPGLFSYGLARMSLALVRAKVIMTVCDPLGRLERHFMEYNYCHNGSLERAQEQSLASVASTREGCFPSASAIWEARDTGQMQRLRDATTTAQHLQTMQALFTGRMLPLHKDFLRQPAKTYSLVADFLGARYAYPEGTTFGRFNVVGGHRTDLCRNRSLVRRLERMLEPEYQAQVLFLRHGGSPVPDSLNHRISRCKSAAMAELRCPGRENAC
ncbi:unnamed protein product [Symbiodinium natans]|uniref:Uncharacterized protein n=1 Tax=Symbiodinium natans TaxID=878477 RepID=A0A812I5R1_9DINO|nr:unnamed protein product [Symbiodinium natans]